MIEIGAQPLRLREFMKEEDGWGRAAGRAAFGRLLEFVESHADAVIFRISLSNVRRIDVSFASETIVEVARRYRCRKGFCFVDLKSGDQEENWEAAAARAKQPLLKWTEGHQASILGLQPSRGLIEALQFALARGETRATEFASVTGLSITNSSSKFKQLWEHGFLLRKEAIAESGGVEYVYARIL